MSKEVEYCSILIESCRPMSDWKALWESFGIFIAAGAAIFGTIKILIELKEIKEQKKKQIESEEKNSQLLRTEFFLQQHRRLFDDPDLSEVLSKIDSDHKDLANPRMHDKKRKFLAYLEEMALLTQSGQIEKKVAMYMFGYYARAAVDGENFSIGIRMDESNWGLLFNFKREADAFFSGAQKIIVNEIKL